MKQMARIKPATARRLTREAIALDRKLRDPTDAARLKGKRV